MEGGNSLEKDMESLTLEEEHGRSQVEEEGEEMDVALRIWNEDMTKMSLGTRLLFVNDFGGAESVFRNGMNHERTQEGEGVRDLRGAFALQYALVSVIKGVASLANDQLDECLQRLWYAEELAAKDSEWLGKSVVRGICTLMGGVIQCLQHSFVKGVYNVLKSWLWIKVLQTQAMDYEGKEREVVRSCALLTLGIFNLLLSLLPTSMLRAASFLSGFRGDREAGLEMLLDCWREDGIFSPWAALVWVAYNVDTKAFLDESLNDADIHECEEIFAWAREKYPNSVFFSGIEADFAACRRDVSFAKQIIDRAAPFANDLKALEWALNYKRGVYELTDLHFAHAAKFFETSLQVYVRVGRRSMVPFMAMYAALCFHVVADIRGRAELEEDEIDDHTHDETASGSQARRSSVADEYEDDAYNFDAATAAAYAEEMLSLVAKYKAMEKDNWGRQDKWAFRVYEEYEAAQLEQEDEGFDLGRRDVWPLLDLVESMVWRMRCTRWMDDMQTAKLLALLQEEGSLRQVNPDDEIRICSCFAQVLLERGERDAALVWCEKGLALEGELSSYGRDSGFVSMLLYLKAINMFQRGQFLSAKHNLSLLDAKDNKKSWIHHYIMFKSNLLKKQLADGSDEDSYVTVDIGAGQSHQLTVTVEEGGQLVSWDWTCMRYDIQFTAIFRPADGSEITMVSSIDRHEDKAGPAVGYFVSPAAGDMIFEWDNRYSFLRSKQIVYRVTHVPADEFTVAE